MRWLQVLDTNFYCKVFMTPNWRFLELKETVRVVEPRPPLAPQTLTRIVTGFTCEHFEAHQSLLPSEATAGGQSCVYAAPSLVSGVGPCFTPQGSAERC